MSDVPKTWTRPSAPMTSSLVSDSSSAVICRRVHVFGTSLAILEALDAIGVRGEAVRARLAAASATVAPPTTAAGGS